MRQVLLGWLAVAVVLVGGRAASAATCTVTDARVLVSNFDLEGLLPSLAGLVIPVEIAEPAGTFRMDFTDFPSTSFTIVGVESDVDLGAQSFGGTIDAGGNVTIPDVPIEFLTHATDPPTSLGAAAALTTGFEALTVSGRDYVTEGAALDFATGTLRLAGHGLVPDAPLAGMPVTTGFSLNCVLEPIPSRENLPPGPSLQRAAGKGKFGKPPGDGSLVGDTLVLKAKLASGETGVDLLTQDLFLELPGELEVRQNGPPIDHSVLVRVPAGTLEQRGKKLVASDEDGSKIRLVRGRKRDGNDAAPVSGTLVVKETKRGLAIALKQTGADLGRLVFGESVVTVGTGPLAASDDATVARGKKSVSIK